MLGQAGFRIIQAPTFLPAYVFSLSGSTSWVGVARACQAVGMLFTPIYGATLIEHRTRVMPMVWLTGALMRLQVLLLALAGFFLGRDVNLVAICVLLGLFGFFTGMQAVTFSVLTSKVIPVENRGRLGGFRNFVAGLVASGVGILGGYLVQMNLLGNGYASVFLVSFVLAALGLCVLLVTREPESPTVRASTPLRARLRELPALVRDDPAYRRYLVARSVGTVGQMALPYYVVYAGERMHLGGADLGWFTGAFVGAQTVSNLVWGVLADRRGFRDVMVGALATWIAATLGLLAADDFASLAVGFVGLGIGLGGFQLGSLNLVLEFGRREDLPMRIAVAQTAEQAVAALAPLAGAALVAVASYPVLFWSAAAAQALALGASLRVEDPRRRPTTAGTTDALG
jgi:MFS family permease